MKKPLKTLLASTILLFIAQQASAEAPPFFNNFGMQAPPAPPVWDSQAPILWADCVPVPENVVNNMNVVGMPNPFIMTAPQMPMMNMNNGMSAPLPVPPPSPFYNVPPPAPMLFSMPSPAPAAPVNCDNGAKDKLVKLQQHYDNASAASRDKITGMEQSLSDVQNQLTNSRLIIESLSKDKNTNADKITGFQTQLKTIEDAKLKLQSQLKTQGASSSEQSKLIVDLDNKNKLLQATIRSLETNAGALKEKLTASDNANKSFKTKLGSLEANAGSQARKLNALGTELTALQSAYKARNDENAALKAKLTEFDNANKSLTAKIGTLESNAGSQARKLNALSQSATELTALQSAYRMRNDENVALKAKLAEYDNANKSLTAKLGTLKSNAGSQARKLTALGQSATELTALQSAYKMRNDENVVLKAKLAELENSLKRSAGTVDACNTEIIDLKGSCKKLGARNDDLAKKLTALGQSATELTALQSAYKMRNDENVVLKAKLAELENSLKQSAGTVDACNTEVIDLKGSCKKLGAANDDLAKKLADAIADTDKDGILDHSDKCPFTTAGTTVNAMGCADDSDKDGVVDADDKCPTSPVGSHVNAEGCPKVKDSDNDGVADGTDMCPTSLAGATVNEFGCAPTANITLDGVNFLTGSSSLTAQSLPILDAAAATIMKNPSIKLEISGHTDNQGNSALNKNLSQRRANTVMIHLIKRGVEAGKLVAKGYGDQNPVADNATDAGRKSNRRVELKIRK